VAPRSQERDERRLRLRVLDHGAEQVCLHVVDGHDRLPQGEGGGLRPAHAYKEGTDEAGPRGDSEHVDLGK
jgi:hypothetical protein